VVDGDSNEIIRQIDIETKIVFNPSCPVFFKLFLSRFSGLVQWPLHVKTYDIFRFDRDSYKDLRVTSGVFAWSCMVLPDLFLLKIPDTSPVNSP